MKKQITLILTTINIMLLITFAYGGSRQAPASETVEEQLYDLLVGSDYANISKWLEIVSKSSLPMTLFLPMEEYNNKTIINDDPFFFYFFMSCR
jgi:hypothetical protein